MDLFGTPWELFSAFFVCLFGCFVSLSVGRKFDISQTHSLIIYAWHSIFCVVYALYVIGYGGDAIDYYESSISPQMGISIGTSAVVYFTRIFSYYLSFSIMGVFLVFNIFGTVGLLAFYGSLRYVSFNKTKAGRLLPA